MGPPSRRSWSLANRVYERSRREAVRRRALFDSAAPHQLEAARRWLLDDAREHEAEDATPEEVLQAIERLFKPDGWPGFVRRLGERPNPPG